MSPQENRTSWQVLWDEIRMFEINPEHPIIRSLDAACKTNPDDQEALRAIDLLYDAALVSSGFTVRSCLDIALMKLI
ncbi:Chaperone protein htpG family protein [Trifolium repens]|nr:Chaperone protein htpG family protein [Trifolium repens]